MNIHQEPDRNCYLPSPEVIREECEKIQAAWTPAQRIQRGEQGDIYTVEGYNHSRVRNRIIFKQIG